MSSTFDEEPRRQPEGWPPTHHESLQHMPVHTPIQVNGRCSESSGSPLYPHPLSATGRWLHHPVAGFPQIPQPAPPFFHHLPTSQAPPPFAFIHEEASKKVAEWHAANNNSTLGQQIWQKQARELEEQRKKSIENGKKSPPAYLIETIPLPTQVSPPANKADLIAPKAIHGDTRRLLEPSSSLSPEETKSNGQPSFAGSHSATDSDEDGHRMEVDPPNGASSPQRPTGTREEPTLAGHTLPFLALPPLPPRPASCNPKVSTSIPKRDEPVDSNANKQIESREDDPSSLLLNFSNQSFINRSASPIRQHAIVSLPKPIHHADPPKPIPLTAAMNGTPHKFQCALCPFSCASKFHFNSHMNTHGDHQCKMCDYISRTEGRLKKHMRESHSAEERAAKGIELQPPKEPKEHKEHKEHKIEHHPATALSLSLNLGSTLSQSLGLGSLQLARPLSSTPPATLGLNGFPLIDAENNHLQTTMASLMEAVNKAVSSQAGSSMAANGQPATSLAAALGLDTILGNLGLPMGDRETMIPIPSALDQIRAFTENPALLPDSPTLANALGAVSQVINMNSPEKADDPSKPAGSARSRSSKQKVYKCKQCPHTDTNKDDHWAHARTHIPADKQMNCPQCMFVTEYKHHLEYHIRNHIGSKPFRCEKCAYMCVNKSMLNSHMKSHNNVYQFRCADCTYATKYCHSLKQHLKKYGHRKRSDDGDHSQTPQSIGSVDSAFQRLTESVGLNIGGPLELKPPIPPTSLAQSLGLGSPFPPPPGLNYPGSHQGPLNLLLRQNSLQLDQLPGLLPGLAPSNVPMKCTVCEFSTGSQEDMIRHNMTHLNLNLLAQVSQSNSLPLPPFLSSLQLPPLPPLHPPNSHDSGIDVVKEESDDHEMTPEHETGESSGCSSSPMGSSGEEEGRDGEGKRKRKMRKLEEISARLSQGKSPSQRSDDSSAQDNNNDDDALVAEPSSSPSDVHGDSLQRTPPAIAHPMPTLPNVEGPLSIYQQALLAHINSMQMKRDEENQAFRFMCPHCKMAFADQSLFHIHMGYHGYEHVFQCQRCGHHAHDPLNFNLHLLQASHQ